MLRKPSTRWTIAALLVAGGAARVAIAFSTYGVQYDMDLLRMVADAIAAPDRSVYETGKWLYPSGFLPIVAVADGVARATGLPFHGVVQLPAIAADLALALIAGVVVLSRGASDRAVIAAVALVAAGPSFVLISGYHGQIDSVAILPAVVGVLVWVRGAPRRALVAGLLIGLAAAIKTVPGICALALLASARDRREALTLLAATAAVPLAFVAPFLAAHPDATQQALTANRGVPGFGGLSALVQPEVTRWWATFEGEPPSASWLLHNLWRGQNLLVGAAVLAVTVLLVRRRTPAVPALVAVWLTVLAVNPNFAFQYVVWLLPFLLLAGRLLEVGALQGALLVPSLLLYFRPDLPGAGWAYWLTVQAAWALMVVIWGLQLRSVARSRPPAP